MKKYCGLILFFMSVCFLQAYSQSLHIDSTRFVTGNKPGTGIVNAIATMDKGILFSGYDYGNPGGIIPYFPLDTGVYQNVLIGKIDSNRQISWIKVYGGSKEDGGYFICQTHDSGYAVLCNTASNNGDVTGFKGGTDIWLLRIDGNGNLLWAKTYGSSASDGAVSVSSTPDHGFIILGVTYGSDSDVPFHYGSMWITDWLVIKTDSVGNVQWSKTIGGTGTEGLGSIFAIDSTYYLVGHSSSKDNDCTDTMWHAGVNTGADYYVLKLDYTGNVLWDSSYGGTGSEGVASAFFDTRDSTIVIIGTTNSVDYMVTGYHGCDNGDMWVIKVNKQGALLWQKTLGSLQIERGYSICPGPNGGYLVYGNTLKYTCDDSAVDDIGYYDGWLFLLDTSGNILSNKVFGGIAGETPASVISCVSGYVATGFSASNSFTEGQTYGNDHNVGGAFVSYLGYSPVSINAITKIDEPELRIYPNPVVQEAKVIAPADADGYLIVLNMMGQAVFAKEVPQGDGITISTNEWVNGMYIVQWRRTDGLMLSAKLVKV